MQKLHWTDYDKVSNFIHDERIIPPTFALAILDGFIPGNVYVDSTSLETILLETNNGIYFIGGDNGNQGSSNFLTDLHKDRKSKGLRFTLFSSSSRWDSIIMDRMPVKQLHRYTYHFTKDKMDLIDLPKGYSIHEITPNLIAKSTQFNEDYYNEYWGSVNNYRKSGYGYCILHEDNLASECTAIFRSKELVEIDIVTSNEYKGRGLANHLARVFINQSLENHLIPSWDCDASNEASIYLAEKLGFKKVNEYSIFI